MNVTVTFVTKTTLATHLRPVAFVVISSVTLAWLPRAERRRALAPWPHSGTCLRWGGMSSHSQYRRSPWRAHRHTGISQQAEANPSPSESRESNFLLLSQKFIADLEMFSSSGNGSAEAASRKKKTHTLCCTKYGWNCNARKCRNTWKMAHRSRARETRT